MTTFSSCDEVFPTNISFQSTGGSKFSTGVVQSGGGQEQRIEQWDEGLGQWDLAYGPLKIAEVVNAAINFANGRRGMSQGFCFFFHEDHTAENMVIGVGDGVTTDFQLVKQYFHGPAVWTPNTPYGINDRVRPSVYALKTYAAIQAGTSGNSEPTWNTALSNLTTDNTVKWTTLTGPDVYLKTIQKPIPGTVLIGVNGVAQIEGTDFAMNYSTGQFYFNGPPALNLQILADYQFYHKVRFANDHMPIQMDMYNVGSIRSIPLVELRPDED